MKTFLRKMLLFVILVAIPSQTWAYTTRVNGICYDLIGSTARVTMDNVYHIFYEGNVIIPEEIEYDSKTYKVTSIGDKAFYKCKRLTSITIPNSVTMIGEDAFYGCEGLTSITFPYSLGYIGDYAFSLCTGLTSITIPNSVTHIGHRAFCICSNVKTLEFNAENCNTCGGTNYNNYSTIDYAFPTSISTVKIGNNVTTIPDYFLYNNFNITNVDIPNSITNIGAYAFCGCYETETIVIPNSVKTIGIGAFENSGKKIVLYPKLDNYNIFGNNTSSYCLYVYESEKDNVEKYWKGKIILLDNPYIITPYQNYIFGVSFKLADNEYCLDKATNTSIILSEPEGESWTLTPDENGVYYKDELKYNTIYQINVSVDTDKGTTRSITEYIQTQRGSVSAEYKTTQTTVTITGVYKSTDKTCKDIKCGVEYKGQEYFYEGKDIKFTGLRPNYEHSIYPFAYYGENKIYNYEYPKTRSLRPKSTGVQGPTTSIITGSYVNGDAHVSETGFTGTLLGKDGVKGDRLNLSGLEPGTEYTVSYYVKTEEGSNETTNYTFTTPALELTTLQPKSVSNTCAIIAAETNIADEETNVGFQWKKYDAPSTLKPSEGYAAIYSGMMEGRVKNLQPTSYYNVRAFYKSASGNYHYGEWVTFDPSDFSYFEPTVHTYPVEEASDGNYNVKGYALAGTDDITEQGFQYGEVGASESKAMRVRAAMSEDGLMTVLATGQVMTATLKNLKPSTTYVCRAFVVTAGGTTYGEEQTFTTKGNTTGIDNAVAEQKEPEITGYYNLSGHRIDAPCKGVNIIRYSDGSARKVVIK